MKRVLPTASLLLAAVLLLTSCMPLYMPPVPSSANILYTDIRVIGVTTADSTIDVSVRGTGQLWLDAQWFAASGTLLASQSVWLELGGNTVHATLPNVAPQFAFVVLSAAGEVLRVHHNETGAP